MVFKSNKCIIFTIILNIKCNCDNIKPKGVFMQLETLKEKIKNKEITINQLEIEDLFKLSEGRFINNAF